MADRANTSKLLATAAALAAAGLASTPVRAQSAPPAAAASMKVGIIDSPVESLIGSNRDTTIRSQSFLPPGREPGHAYTAARATHGTVVASAFAQQARSIAPGRGIEIYSAFAFYKLPPSKKATMDGEKPPERIALDYGAASRALDWFKAEGVRVVVTAFITEDNRDMRAFMARARELDMVVFAASNNDPAKFAPFPARDPWAIAVTGNNYNLDFQWNRGMDNWIKFAADGSIPRGRVRDPQENGSSFAAGRAAAFGSYVVANRPNASRDEIVATMSDAVEVERKTGIGDLSAYRVVSRFVDADRRRAESDQAPSVDPRRTALASSR